MRIHPIAIAACLLMAGAVAQAATWTPIAGGQRARTLEVTSNGVFTIPQSIASKGGVLRFTLVGGGEGGHASKSSCDDYAVQGGKGGDGGEVIDIDITVRPGQCAAGIGIVIGAAGKGAYRGGNASPVGEPGQPTSISCSGTVMSFAMGGGRRPDAKTASKSAKGGLGGVIMNTLDSVGTTQPMEQRSTSIQPGGAGQEGRAGYGSGGGGGGVSVALTGSAVRPDGTVVNRATVRNAPLGKAGYGAGSGAGPFEYGSESNAYAAENGAQYGSGGGGGAAACGINSAAREGGAGYPGLVRIQWAD